MCIIALLAVIALQILLLRSMFSMETESYRLLSHIGLNGVTAKRSVLWQILTFALGGLRSFTQLIHNYGYHRRRNHYLSRLNGLNFQAIGNKQYNGWPGERYVYL